MAEGSYMPPITPPPGGPAHLEQYAALLGEGQVVEHRAADVPEDGSCHCHLCYTGHQLGRQEGLVWAGTVSPGHRNGGTTGHGQATPPARNAPV